MGTEIVRQATVPDHLLLMRLDRAVGQMFPEFSRSRLQAWIKSGELTVDGELRRPRDKVQGGEEIELVAALQDVSMGPERVEFETVHIDDAVIVVNKPVGLVVHPGAGNLGGTLLNGLLHRFPELAKVPRAGIVHRLDKDTSGLMIVARTLESQHALVQQLQQRSVRRIYQAVAYGKLELSGTVEAPIGRNPDNRLKMAVIATGKAAVTHYRVLRSFEEYSHVELRLETGRTHQIRVHMQKLGCPLIGDVVYGGGFKEPRNKDPDLIELLRHFPRQALHACRLAFDHPGTGERVEFEVPLPEDMNELLTTLGKIG